MYSKGWVYYKVLSSAHLSFRALSEVAGGKLWSSFLSLFPLESWQEARIKYQEPLVSGINVGLALLTWMSIQLSHICRVPPAEPEQCCARTPSLHASVVTGVVLNASERLRCAFPSSSIYHNISMVPFPKRDPSLSEDKWLAKFQSWDLDPDLWLKSLIAFHSRGRGRFMSKDKQPTTRCVYLKRQTRIVVVAGSQRHSDSCFIHQDGRGHGWGGDGMGTTYIRALKPHGGSVLPLSPLWTIPG